MRGEKINLKTKVQLETRTTSKTERAQLIAISEVEELILKEEVTKSEENHRQVHSLGLSRVKKEWEINSKVKMLDPLRAKTVRVL